MLSVVMLSVVMLRVVMLSVVMLSVFMLSVVMLNVVIILLYMLSVVAPGRCSDSVILAIDLNISHISNYAFVIIKALIRTNNLVKEMLIRRT